MKTKDQRQQERELYLDSRYRQKVVKDKRNKSSIKDKQRFKKEWKDE